MICIGKYVYIHSSEKNKVCAWWKASTFAILLESKNETFLEALAAYFWRVYFRDFTKKRNQIEIWNGKWLTFNANLTLIS